MRREFARIWDRRIAFDLIVLGFCSMWIGSSLSENTRFGCKRRERTYSVVAAINAMLFAGLAALWSAMAVIWSH
jgi:hypothetical protein